jgi:hypothetical protein
MSAPQVQIFKNGKLRTGTFHRQGGGFVETTAFVNPLVRIDPMVCVLDKAKVLGPVQWNHPQLAAIIAALEPFNDQLSFMQTQELKNPQIKQFESNILCVTVPQILASFGITSVSAYITAADIANNISGQFGGPSVGASTGLYAAGVVSIISGQCIISDNAVIQDALPDTPLVISPNFLQDHVEVRDNAIIYGGSVISGYSIIDNDAEVIGLPSRINAVNCQDPKFPELVIEGAFAPPSTGSMVPVVSDQAVIRRNAFDQNSQLQYFESLPYDFQQNLPENLLYPQE